MKKNLLIHRYKKRFQNFYAAVFLRKSAFNIFTFQRKQSHLCSRSNFSYQKGYSIFELLVVIMVFGILATVVSTAFVSTLRSSKKSEGIGRVKEEAEYTVAIIERLLRNAKSLNCSSSSGSLISYVDERGVSANFQCAGSSGAQYIASNSASTNNRLTSSDVTVTNCASVFACSQGTSTPDSVTITLNLQYTKTTEAEGAQTAFTTKILLRNY